ncbi:MAG: beta-lactamase family protein [Sphingomonas sp.]|nr:beta-lactamase family protein [Sphingomonas sp.]
MLQTNRSLLHRTASAISWWASPDRVSGEAAPLPQTLGAIAESAVAGGYAAGVGLGLCLPIKTPAFAGFGWANLETQTPVDRDAIFRVGACTRQVTAAAILLLAERGELRLDDTIDIFLPNEPDTGRVRVRDLLLANNAAYALLGRIVEVVTSESFVGFVTGALLGPAGMTASRFPNPTEIIPHRASGYRLAGGCAHDFRNAGAGHGAVAADGLYTTASDLLLWNRALHSGRLISRSALDQMIYAGGESGPCPALAPFLDRHARGFGLEVGRLFGRRACWQHGQAPGFDAWLFHFPDDRADLALLANTEQGATTILEPMLRAILRV